MKLSLWAATTLLSTCCLAWSDGARGTLRAEAWAEWNVLRGDAYALDGVARWMEQGQRATCDARAMVSYRGTNVRYAGAVRVSPPFRERLERFETVVNEVAREVYGRAPRRVVHFGAYSCRSTRKSSRLLSEHALGNAIDVMGFDFGPVPKGEPLSPDLGPALKHAFQVRVGKHWSATKGVAATHALFLRTLTDRLRSRPDIFRSMFGPGHGGHDDHLHFDVAPWRYIDL